MKKCDSILTMTKHRSVAESAPALRLSNSATYLSMFIEPFLINVIQTFKIRQHENNLNRNIGQR